MADKVKIGTMWFSGCSGCHLSIADFHESLIDVMEFADFEFSPVLMDTKYDEVPELDIIIVEGGVRNDENRASYPQANHRSSGRIQRQCTGQRTGVQLPLAWWRRRAVSL